MAKKKVIIIGAGPAGLAAAYELIQKAPNKYQIDIFETEARVGGLSKTLLFKRFRFDVGGHRFYTKYPEIDTFYKKYLGKEMLKRNRLSRIYYGGKYYNYPLSASNALANLGIIRSSHIFFSWLIRQFNKYKNETSLNEWVSNRFGDQLFKIFFKSYTEKVWGIPTSKLSADWASQRIENFNLLRAIINAVFKINPGSKTIIKEFYYPKLGPSMLYEKIKKELTAHGVNIHLEQFVEGFKRGSNSIKSVKIRDIKRKNRLFERRADIIVSTMPLDKLILYLRPPKNTKRLVQNLKFRNFIAVNLVVAKNPFPDQWIYIHDPSVKVGRIQNFRNWSPYMVKSKSHHTPIGMEYFCTEGDELWNMSNLQLLNLAKKEIVQTGLVQEKDILDGFVYKVKNAYPVYNFDYQKPLKISKLFAQSFKNLYLCGRGGLFRYNNQDHSILTGFYVARSIINSSDNLNVWSINENKEYYEEK